MNSNELMTLKDLVRLKDWLEKKFKDLEAGRNHSKRWIKSEEAREILGCSKGTLQNLLANGELKASKVLGTRYFSLDDIEKMMERNKLFSQN